MRPSHASYALLPLLLFAACERQAPAPAAQTSANTLRVVATDFAFAAPDTVAAGLTNIVIVNQGKEPHQAVVMRIDSAKTPAEIQAGMMGSSIPAWMVFPGGPNGAMPGDSTNATAVLTPGNYMLVCFLSGADGKPHLMKGMTRQMVVKAAGPAMAMPAGDVTITAKDYAFDVSAPITAGRHTIRMVNVGPQLHEIGLLRVAPGKTMAQVGAWMQSDMKGPPPFMPMGGIAGLSVGQTANFTTTFAPGDYILICFVPDAKDGKPHVAHGMMLPFKVS
jgi:hypothetical protein